MDQQSSFLLLSSLLPPAVPLHSPEAHACSVTQYSKDNEMEKNGMLPF